ncbi:hypothetical protein [Terriglobus saanensis]|uniref:Uncharacterized protein n=1 Tax=Terriglobus saanensis (strain ATCC BAA-1853 / DSM 23119 / SP1PR4) TaxID=401053 RepID=E8V5J4_TERSS|nr:hypothetical protein [Terriglobus saanensis]ADV81528.1 hypothetical protein AciPR4_0695 [Terriglobus saanensis SP1PR4]
MNPLNSQHLSSEDFDIALFGVPSASATAHLATCAACSGELSSLRTGFGDLRLATTALATENLRDLDRIGGPRTLRLPRARRTLFTMPRIAMATAAFAFAIGAPVALHHRNVAPVAVTPTQATPQISDEALLSTIQSDLNTSVPVPLLPLTSTTSTTENQKED